MYSRPPVHPVRGRMRRARGFSLIEALIAVVVLSTGLLALAALQSALIRSSVDARIRSSATATAMSILDDLRAGSYKDLVANAGAVAAKFVPPALPPTYATVDPAAGGYTVQIATQPWHDRAGVFVQAPYDPNSAFPPPLGEFTQVDVTVQWTDPAGGTRSITLSDIVGKVASFTQAPDRSRLGSSINPPKPIVRTDNPAGPGVIPIAVGDGRESAATNPKPVRLGAKSGNIETRFNVLTFAPAGLEALIQKRVETSVIGCRCVNGGGGTLTGIFAKPFRPTFWDGARYVPPKVSNDPVPAGPATGNDIIQSQLCDDCCRDHHDPSNLGSGEPEFDPFRSDAHDHFKLDSTNTLVKAGNNEEYREACRLIRVDGLWRVAADMRNTFFGLLKTSEKDGVPAAKPEPDTTAADTYKNFVLKALDRQFISGTLPSDPAMADAVLATDYNGFGLDTPTNLNITRSSTDKRWLHARGLYIDHVEPVAQDRINKAKQDCTNNSIPLNSCNILSFVPFTTVNLTELAEWEPIAGPVIAVTNTSGQDFGNPLDPVRGRVNAIDEPPDGSTANAIARIGRSNAGVAIVLPIDPEDRDQSLSDTQRFTVSSAGGSTTDGEPFEVRLSGNMPRIGDSSSGNDPSTSSIVSGVSEPCSAVGVDLDPTREYVCPTNSPLNVAASVVVGGYNFASTITEAVTCVDGTQSATETLSRPVCQNYRIASASVNGSALAGPFTVTGDGALGETTRIDISSLAPNDVVEALFEFEGSIKPLIAACKVTGGGKIQSISFKSCP